MDIRGQRVGFRKYYHLESYLFDEVRPRFAEQGYLTAFDFFCIVIWKANRAKSKIAEKLLELGFEDLESAVQMITYGLAKQQTAGDRLRYLFETCELRLPMASAILTVLYPDEFTVYDWRVCEQLKDFKDFHKLNNLTNFDNLWRGYQEYKRKVEESCPKGLILRDKDRYLWGKSFAEDLTKDIKRGFRKGDRT